ncbi:MAG: FkbM family methyltransferase [Microthrixaceae bacterium]
MPSNQSPSRFVRTVRRRWDRFRWRGGRSTVLAGPGRGLLFTASAASAEYVEGTNELPVQRRIVDVLTPGATFVDIGANAGFFSLLAARCVGPSGSVVAFEPVEELARSARANAELNDFRWMEVRNCAVGASRCTATLEITEHAGGATLAGNADPAEVTSCVEVEVVSLAALLDEGAIAEPDLIKIDVEGYEFPVLDGIEPLFTRRRPVMIIELDAPDDSELAVRCDQMVRRLCALGFTVEHLEPSYVGTDWSVAHLFASDGGQRAF